MNFFIEQTPTERYHIKYNPDGDANFFHTTGTLLTLQARVFGLSLAQYCRMCRDLYGATLRGKTGWPVVEFSDKKECTKLVDELNRKFSSIKKQRENLTF